MKLSSVFYEVTLKSMKTGMRGLMLVALGMRCGFATADLTQTFDFHIAPQGMGAALLQYSEVSGVQVTSASTLLDGRASPGLAGSFGARAALERLLAGSGLTFDAIDSRTVVIHLATTRSAPSTRSEERSPAADSSRAADSSIARFRVAQTPVGSTQSSVSVGSGSENGNAPANDLLEIVVTARKQSESLQSVPLSVTALSAASLQNVGASSMEDIGRQVPGLSVVSAAPGQNTLILRGISSAGGNSPTVGFYLDDIPLPSPQWAFAGGALDAGLLDLDHVEVLRGPEGTLYGASSMGGTVKYATHQPTGTFSGFTETSVSETTSGGLNYGENVVLNVPLSDRVAVRGDAFYRYDDGYIDRYRTSANNILAVDPGAVEKDANTDRTIGGRISLRASPIDAVTVTPSILYQKISLGAPFTFDSPPGTFADPIQSRLLSEPSVDKLTLPSLLAEANFGPFSLTSSTSYFDRTLNLVEDVSKFTYFVLSPSPQTYVYPTPFSVALKVREFAQETRLSADLWRTHWLVGVYYSHDSDVYDGSYPVTAGYNAAFGNPFGDQPFYSTARRTRIDNKALFSEINIHISSQFEATVGARAFKVSQALRNYAAGVFEGGVDVVERHSTDSGVTPKFALDYHATPDTLLYASATKGFRPGGGLGTLPATLCAGDLKAIGLSTAPTSYSADTLWSYEAGAKTASLDRTLTINGDIYYIRWSSVQQSVSLPTCGAVFTGNFGTAISKGSELEVDFDPNRAWHISVGGAFNQAQLTSTIAGAQGQPGQVLEDAPKWMSTVTAQYTRQIRANTSVFGLVNFSTTSREYNNFDPASNYYSSAGYSLANARLGMKASRWQASLFCNNLFDRRAETALPVSNAADLPVQRRIALNRPRTVGLDFRWSW